MSNINKILKNVEIEYKALSEVCEILRGKRLTKKDLADDGDYPVFHGGLIPLGRYNEFNRKASQTMVINTGSVGEVVWSGVDFWSSDGTFVIKTPDNIEDKYLYYFLKTKESYLKSQKRDGGVPTIDKQVVGNIQVPIPSMEIQKEIVRVLDSFTELEAELEARKKQYEYYRNQLLDFSALTERERERVEWCTLTEIAMYSKDRIDARELDHDNYVSVNNILQNRTGKTSSVHVPEKGKFTRYDVDDILLGNIRPYLKKIWYADRTGGTNGDVLPIRIRVEHKDKVDSKYLYQVLASDKFFDYGMRHAKGAKMPRGDKSAIMRYKIPIPPMVEQNRIVAILDKFDKLVNDISEGLPAEIKARRQQYEYYRNKLLTFDGAIK